MLNGQPCPWKAEHNCVVANCKSHLNHRCSARPPPRVGGPDCPPMRHLFVVVHLQTCLSPLRRACASPQCLTWLFPVILIPISLLYWVMMKLLIQNSQAPLLMLTQRIDPLLPLILNSPVHARRPLQKYYRDTISTSI